MNVYQQISRNKMRTWLILGFFVLIVSIFFYLLGFYFQDPILYFAIGFLFSLFSGVFSYYNSDKIVLMFSGAKPADKQKYFDFYTTAENLSIAAGMPMPKLYVIDDPTPNAFATGRNPEHAVVAATTGLLQRLDRSDIEGVIAHELSHIKNYDILVSSIVAVLVGTIVFIADMALRSLWWGGGRSDRRSSNNAVGLILFLISIIVIPIAAKLIQLAISRRREYLADASGVMLTRNPKGLADALEKISSAGPMHNVSHAVSHLYISNPEGAKKKSNFIASLFSTHPPIEERIRILRSMK